MNDQDDKGALIRSRIEELAKRKSHRKKEEYITRELFDIGADYEVIPLQKKYRRGSADDNIVVKVPGETDEELVFTSHWDVYAMGEGLKNIFRRKRNEVNGPGANDNGSGVSVLLESIKSDIESGKKPKYSHTYLFCGGEEGNNKGLRNGLLTGANISTGAKLALDGTAGVFSPYTAGAFAATLPFSTLGRYQMGVCGSKDYVERLSKAERKKIKSAVSVDMVGSGEFVIPKKTMGIKPARWVVPYRMDDDVRERLRRAALDNGAKYMEDLGIGSSDHISFAEKGIPCGALLAVDRKTLGRVHTMKDVPGAVDTNNLEKAYAIIEGFKESFEEKEKGSDPIIHSYDGMIPERAEVFKGKKDSKEYIVVRRCNPSSGRYLNSVYAAHADGYNIFDVDSLVREDTEAKVMSSLKDYKRQRYERVLKDEGFAIYGLGESSGKLLEYSPAGRSVRLGSFLKKAGGQLGCTVSDNGMPLTIGVAMGAGTIAGNAVPFAGPLTMPMTYAASAGAAMGSALTVQKILGTSIPSRSYDALIAGENGRLHLLRPQR